MVGTFQGIESTNVALGPLVCLIPDTSPLQSRAPEHTTIGGSLDTQRIVSELKAERNRLDKAISVLDGTNTTGATVSKHATSMDGAQAPRKRHHLTAAGRKRLSMLMKKRWAEKRKKAS